MRWVVQFFVQHRTVSSLSLTVLLSLWMISSSKPGQTSIARALGMTAFYPLQFTLHQVTRVKNIFSENRRLREQLTELNTRLAYLKEEGEENKRLREKLSFAENFSYTLVPVRVVAHEPSHEFRSLVINAGSDRGLARYMPLVDERGVAGRVIQVLAHMSLVQLLRDPSNRTSVLTSRSRVVGILETEDGRRFFVRYRTHADVAPGDTVVTSGLGGVYPKGLFVGRVVEFTDENDPLFKKGWIEPAVDFDRLEEAFVLRLSPQWAAFQDALDSAGLAP